MSERANHVRKNLDDLQGFAALHRNQTSSRRASRRRTVLILTHRRRSWVRVPYRAPPTASADAALDPRVEWAGGVEARDHPILGFPRADPCPDGPRLRHRDAL